MRLLKQACRTLFLDRVVETEALQNSHLRHRIQSTAVADFTDTVPGGGGNPPISASRSPLLGDSSEVRS